jgi:tetratricopeptide (TPR) repeat protein
MIEKNKFKRSLYGFGSFLRNWISKFTHLKHKNIEKAESYFKKSRAFSKSGNNKQALKTINKAIEYDPENISYSCVKYLILKRMKKYKKLVGLLEFFPEHDFDKVPIYCDRSRIMIQELKKYKKAIKIIDKGLLITPDEPRLIELKLEALIKMQKFDKAWALFNEVQVQTSNNHENDYQFYI